MGRAAEGQLVQAYICSGLWRTAHQDLTRTRLVGKLKPTRIFDVRCAPYPKQNYGHRGHENITIQSIRKEETNAFQNILTRQSPVHITCQFNPFKALSVNIVEHKVLSIT
jgi:hypothetical protein